MEEVQEKKVNYTLFVNDLAVINSMTLKHLYQKIWIGVNIYISFGGDVIHPYEPKEQSYGVTYVSLTNNLKLAGDKYSFLYNNDFGTFRISIHKTLNV